MKFLLLSVLLIVFDRNSFAQLTQGDPRCPVDYAYDLSIFYPHESDCRKFYQCAEYGQLKEKICEHGMEFNRVENKCAVPDGKCTLNQRITTDDSNKLIHKQYDHYKICTPEQDGLLFANHNDNCKSFFKCNKGKAYKILCGNGLLFNEKTNYCDWDFNVQCQHAAINNDYNKDYHPPNCATVPDGSLFANYQDRCKSFFICSNGKYFQKPCQGALVFNEFVGACDWPENVRCVCDTNCIGAAPLQQQPLSTTSLPYVSTAVPPTPTSHGPAEPECTEPEVQIPLCPPQPCPPENCLLQACIPQPKYWQNMHSEYVTVRAGNKGADNIIVSQRQRSTGNHN